MILLKLIKQISTTLGSFLFASSLTIAAGAVLSGCALNESQYKNSAITKTANKKILNDIWVLEAIQGETIALTSDTERPRLEIQLADMRIMGTDGCNGYFASIDFIDEQKIQFGPIASTRKYCAEMAIPDSFGQQMDLVKIYQIENLKLRLFDEAGHEILLFQKVD